MDFKRNQSSKNVKVSKVFKSLKNINIMELKENLKQKNHSCEISCHILNNFCIDPINSYNDLSILIHFFSQNKLLIRKTYDTLSKQNWDSFFKILNSNSSNDPKNFIPTILKLIFDLAIHSINSRDSGKLKNSKSKVTKELNA